MSEDSIFRELQEDIARQRYSDLWKKYGSTLIGMSIAVVVGTAGGVVWKEYKHHRDAGYTATLISAVQTRNQDITRQREAFQVVLKDASGHPHATLGALTLAGQELEAGNAKEALALYIEIANDSRADTALRNLAKVLALSVATEHGLEVPDITPPKDESAFASEWKEMVAWRDYKAGKKEEAYQQFTALKDDGMATPSQLQRVSVMAAFLAADVTKKDEK